MISGVSRFGVLFAASIVLASSLTKAQEKGEIPEYVGSQACLGCHPETYRRWKPSNHATMAVPITNLADLPLDISKAPANLQPELREATFMIANSFFVARDAASGHYKTLGVIYDKAAKEYKPSGFSLNWSTACVGCHTTNMNTPKMAWSEPGIGCEACHGPGRDHALGKGDVSKIVSSRNADVCGQCHGGNDVQTGGNLMSDGTKWIVGFRPGMKLSDLNGVQLTPVDPSKTPPDPGITANHLRNYNMWAASPHSKALSLVSNNERAGADCYGCHSAEGFAAKLKGEKVDISKKASFNTVSCVACHDPHNSDNPRQLAVAPEKLCVSCHRQEAVLKGTGAKGIEDTRGFHSDLNCVQCHMTEANHLMKVIRPDAADLAEKRADTCTSCHKVKSKVDLAAQLQEWQSEYQKRMDSLQADLKTISAASKEKPDLLNGDMKGQLNGVRGNLMVLTSDKSRGAHNFQYAAKIMEQAGKDLESLMQTVRSPAATASSH